MTADVIQCPYCNASMRLTPEDAARPRIACPRCGDSFPNRDYQGDAPAESNPALLRESEAMRVSNAGIARIIVILMICSAVVGGLYAVSTVAFRRHNDPPRKGIPQSQFAALSFLPADSRIAGVWDLAAMRNDAGGKSILKQISANDINSAQGQLAFQLVNHWTGLQANDIDRIAIGVRLNNGLPRLTLVAQSTKPRSLKQFNAAFAKSEPSRFGDQPVYRVKIKPVGEALVWRRDNLTTVVDVHLLPAKLDDLKELPIEPHKKLDAFRPIVTETLNEQSKLAGSFFWFAGDLEGLPLANTLLILGAKAKEKKTNPLSKIKLFRLGMRLQDGVVINAEVQAKDANAAREIQAFVEANKPKAAESFSVIGPGSTQRKTDQADGQTVSVQMRVDANRFSQLLGEMMNLNRIWKVE